MNKELLDIVDENDRVVGQAERHEIYAQNLTSRICQVMVRNSAGKIALQKRSTSVSFMPGSWGCSAGGHVSSGDDYESSAYRELREEIGVSGKIIHMDTVLYKNTELGYTKFLGIFQLIYDGEFFCSDGEVEFVAFYSVEEIKTMIAAGDEFHPELLFILEEYFF